MQRQCPYLATDIIIEYPCNGKPGLVLIERKNPPHGLALPGGFAEYGISLEDNACKEASEETGLSLILRASPLAVKSDPSRDPRGHVISVVYVAKGSGKVRAGDDAARARVYSIDDVIDLVKKDAFAFDHADILRQYLKEEGYEV